MRAEDLLIDHGRARQAVEAIREGLPKLDPEAALALVVKAVNTIDGSALVVPPQDEEILGIFNLVRQEEANGLEGAACRDRRSRPRRCNSTPGGSRRTRTAGANRSIARERLRKS